MNNKKTKKKNSPQADTQLSSLKINIDYEELAKAIIMAQEQVNHPPVENHETCFIKIIWLILRGKKDTKDKLTMGLMAILMVLLFKSISIVGFIAIPAFIVVLVKQIISMTWTFNWILIWNIFTIFLFILLIAAISLYSVIIWGASYEIENSKDKHFVAAIFSGFVSLAALVVSLIALNS